MLRQDGHKHAQEAGRRADVQVEEWMGPVEYRRHDHRRGEWPQQRSQTFRRREPAVRAEHHGRRLLRRQVLHATHPHQTLSAASDGFRNGSDAFTELANVGQVTPCMCACQRCTRDPVCFPSASVVGSYGSPRLTRIFRAWRIGGHAVACAAHNTT